MRLWAFIVHLFRQAFPRLAAFLEFPSSPVPRYGWGRPEYPQFLKACEEKRSSIEHLLTSFFPFQDQLVRIPRRSSNDGIDPAWENDMFPTLDAIALYCMLSLYRPARYLEIGAGHSTKFARRAIHLPYDYPPEWAPLYYNEQYVLAAYILGGNRFLLLLAYAFITGDSELHQILDSIWNAPAMQNLPNYGGSLWGVIVGQSEPS
jgi:hypothetical protein